MGVRAAPTATRRRGAPPAGRSRDSTRGRRRASAAARAARAAHQGRRLRPAWRERVGRPRRGAGSGSPGRTHGGCTSGSPSRSRAGAGARTSGGRSLSSPGRGGARPSRGRGGGCSRPSGRARRAPPADSSRAWARSPPAPSVDRQRAPSRQPFQAQEATLVLDAEPAVAADTAGRDDPVAGDEEREPVLGTERPRSACGAGSARERRELAVRDHLAPRDGAESGRERVLERRSPASLERHVRERDRLAGEVAVERSEQFRTRSRHRFAGTRPIAFR